MLGLTHLFKSSGKLKPTTFWFSSAEKPFSVFPAMYFYLSFSSRHNTMKRKYASSPRTTNKRENYSKCCSIHLLCLKNSISKRPGVEWGKRTMRHCYRPPLCCWLCSMYDDGHSLAVILSPAKRCVPPSTSLNSWLHFLPLPNEVATSSPNKYYKEAQLPAR